jgi:MFS family permease
VAFVPWVLFTFIGQRSTLLIGALIAFAAAVIIAFPATRAHHPKALEVGAVVAFAGFSAVAIIADHSTTVFMARYARAIAAAVLALIALSSLLITPFTEQYARESVPQEFRSSETFKRINRQLTLMWAGVFLLMIPSHIAAGLINTHRANLIFNWLIPVGLIVLAAKRTEAAGGDAGHSLRPKA